MTSVSQIDKIRARRAAQSARKNGLIARPHTCQCVDTDCPIHPGKACMRGDFTATKLEAHHPDHAKPLEVTFYCNPCHKLADERTQMTAPVIAQAKSLRAQGLSLSYIAKRLGVSIRTLRKHVDSRARMYIDLNGGQDSAATPREATGQTGKSPLGPVPDSATGPA